MSEHELQPAKTTPLHALHLEQGAKMTGFAGYAMPLHYPAGVLAEHLHTRSAASLFDVSHMGQILLTPSPGGRKHALELLVAADIAGLAPGRQRYGLLTTDSGGVLDDLMVANLGDSLFAVVNASRADADEAYLRQHLSDNYRIERLAGRALLALQGPLAAQHLSALASEIADMRFLDVRRLTLAGIDCIVARSGYTGEDGFEISLPAAHAKAFARLLLEGGAAFAGLAARDSLRLEAGLCLYGADLDETTTPVEAGLGWSIGKSRRGGGFPGAPRILRELADGPARRRVGLLGIGKAPVRSGAALFIDQDATDPVGLVTSGGFGPSVGGPIAMGYVTASNARPDQTLYADLRGRRVPFTVSTLPFVPTRYRN